MIVSLSKPVNSVLNWSVLGKITLLMPPYVNADRIQMMYDL